MHPLSASQARYQPIARDQEVEGRVLSLIGRAKQRQLWMLFLTKEDVQLPVLIPLADYPSSPSPEAAAQLSIALRHCVDEIDAAKVVLVWERCQSSALTATDKAWAKVAAQACQLAQVPLRAQLVSHKAGVRWIAPDDCL
jgi:hypothetical protein